NLECRRQLRTGASHAPCGTSVGEEPHSARNGNRDQRCRRVITFATRLKSVKPGVTRGETPGFVFGDWLDPGLPSQGVEDPIFRFAAICFRASRSFAGGTPAVPANHLDFATAPGRVVTGETFQPSIANNVPVLPESFT